MEGVAGGESGLCPWYVGCDAGAGALGPEPCLVNVSEDDFRGGNVG